MNKKVAYSIMIFTLVLIVYILGAMLYTVQLSGTIRIPEHASIIQFRLNGIELYGSILVVLSIFLTIYIRKLKHTLSNKSFLLVSILCFLLPTWIFIIYSFIGTGGNNNNSYLVDFYNMHLSYHEIKQFQYVMIAFFVYLIASQITLLFINKKSNK